MQVKFIIGIFFLSCLNVMGQSVDDFKGAVSPQVALMNRYGDYPVDLSNGLVDISIPLYTIKTTSLSLPLQLKFHASGLRADEREGLFGIRWALSGGGSVSRIIKGYPDEYYPFNNIVNSSTYTPDFNTLYGTTSTLYKPGGSYNDVFTMDHTFPNGTFKKAGQYKDTEYDIFSYTLPSGKSGKFILQGSTGVPMPYEPLKIYVMKDGSVGYNRVTIVDEDGITYQFGGQYVDGNESGWVTTWHLTSITSANKQDIILLDYIRPDIYTNFYNNSLVISDNLHDNDAFSKYTRVDQGHMGEVYESELYQLIGELLTDQTEYFKQTNTQTQMSKACYSLKSIQYEGGASAIGRIDFSYQKDKYNQTTYLDTVIVSDAQNKPVKKIHFLLKNNLSGNLKLLDKLEFLDLSNSTNKYAYTFNYYDSSSVPGCGNLSADCDWWGYYSLGAGGLKSSSVGVNAVNNSGNYIYPYPVMQIQGGDKHTDEPSMEIGMLKSIQYPTGGQTEFEYEGNRMPSGLACGGLRIKRVKNEPEQGKTESRYYTYGSSMMPDYLHPDISRFNNIYTENEVSCYVNNNALSSMNLPAEGSYIQRTFQSTVPSQYTDFQSNTVYYSDVTEHIENSSGSGDNGRTEYKYNIRLTNSSYFNTPDGDNFEGYHDPSSGYKQVYVSPTDFWRVNELASKIIYNSSQKIKEYQYEYQPYRKESIFDMPVFRYRNHRVWMDQTYGSGADNEREIMLIYPDQVYETFAFKHQEYSIGADKLVKETEYSYDNNGIKSSTIKEFTYDPNYLLPVSESITNSNGDMIQTKKQYSFNASASPYDEMVSKNILSDVIRTDRYKGNSLLETSISNYASYPSTGNFSSYKPASIARGTYGVAELRIYNMLYDNRGNPQYMEKDGVAKIAYLWSYNYQYCIAKIEGLTYDEVVAAVGADYLNKLSAELNPTKDEIEQIRSKISGSGKMSLVSTYTYVPLVGLVTATDPKGTVTTYTYDTFNRLMNIKNDDGNTWNEYRYHYYNQ